MGGIPPLGYDVENRRLVVNEQEAETVRYILRTFVQFGSSTLMVPDLKRAGLRSKSWTTQDGKVREGKPIDKSLIYKVLSNRTYLGELRHKDQWYPGEHEPIIDQKLWDQVQSILANNCRHRGNTTRAQVPALLKGMIFTADGRAMTPHHTRKKGRLYRYYVSTRDQKEGPGASGVRMLPAGEVEEAVLAQVRGLLKAPEMVMAVWREAEKLDDSLDEAQVAVALHKIEAVWDQLFPAEQTRLLRLLVERVTVTPEALQVKFRPSGIEQLALTYGPVEQPEPAEAVA